MNENKLILAMGWVTLLLFPAIGIGVLYFINGNWQFIFTGGWHIYYQIPLGVIIGIVVGYSLKWLLSQSFYNDFSLKYGNFFNEFKLVQHQYVFLSVCAGVGEEILFRGMIQYFAGIYLTSVLFVALHGYLNPTDRKVLSYGLLLTLIFFGVGHLMVITGIYTCIILHIIIDVILFQFLADKAKNDF